MTTSLKTTIRRSLGVIVAVAIVACVAAGSALSSGRPAASYYTKQQLQVMAERGAAKAAHDLQTAADNRPAASYYTKQQLQVMAERGAAKAAHDSLTIPVPHPAASYYTKQQLQTMSQSWAVRAALSSVSNAKAVLASLPSETRNALLARLGQTPVVTSSQSSFGWSDFGIGAAGMLGLVLLAGGAFLAVRFGRRSGSVPVQRPV
jgi:hypothetical protein